MVSIPPRVSLWYLNSCSPNYGLVARPRRLQDLEQAGWYDAQRPFL